MNHYRLADLTPGVTESFTVTITEEMMAQFYAITMTAAVGTPVRAAGSGVVTAVYDDEYLGTTVIVNHPDGHVSQYSNLAVMPSVSAGDSVEAGQTIGAVGATALLEIADEPHLHFAVYANGDTIDPAEFIR